jgi:rare lipoprotein A
MQTALTMQFARSRRSRVRSTHATLCVLGVFLAGMSQLGLATGAGDAAPTAQQAPREIDPSVKAKPDISGRKQYGEASFYAKEFAGRKMADGTTMDPQSNNAASRTLPLGTTARVTNLATGQSAVVTIKDRGPYVRGRIVDLSPSTARRIGITPSKGIAKVVVAPIAVPLPNGAVKPGQAAQE